MHLLLLLLFFMTVFLLQCYIDPLAGCRFYSKPEVLRYLKTIKRKTSTSKKRKTDNGMSLVSKVYSFKLYYSSLMDFWLSLSVTMNFQIWIVFVPYKVIKLFHV